jgi:hypothetical protein
MSYRQLTGVAMGTRIGPSIASLAIGYLEEKLYGNLRSLKNEEYTQYVQNNFKRFLTIS